MQTFGTTVVNIKKSSSECPPPSSIPDDIAGTKGLLKEKSYFLEKPITLTADKVILPFTNSDIFNFNYYAPDDPVFPGGGIKNYGGIDVFVYFLPSGTSIDDVRVIRSYKYEYYYCNLVSEKLTPDGVKKFDSYANKFGREGDKFIDVEVKIDNIVDNVGIPLFVTVGKAYSNSKVWFGSFYI